MKLKELIQYLLVVILLGLLQIWVLIAFLKLKQIHFQFIDVIKDGGMFFFATSLAATSLLKHGKIFNRVSSFEIIWSIMLVFVIVVISIVGIASAIDTNNKAKIYEITLNSTQINCQLIGSSIAILYGCISEMRVNSIP